jgi:hypothetical protein
MKNQWFDVDKDGLSKLIEQQGKGRLIAELLQNALDENVSIVTITINPQPGRPLADLTVEDDSPDGFRELAHAYTLFADSYKKANPEKRGRFNLGEKLTLAMCRSATISTTTGTVTFDEDGTRHINTRSRRERGSVFLATMRMNRTELDEVIGYLHTILVPPGVTVTVNGQPLPTRLPCHSFEASLETVVADGDGVLHERTRRTRIELHEPKEGETPSLFELGLPVVETGDRWHINVGQKVPLNSDRDNVRPAFLRKLRTLVYNETHDRLNPEDANATWVQEATSDPACSEAAITTFMDLRFGENRAAFDPSDPEANKQAVARGSTIVTGGMLNRQQWRKAKDANAIVPAGHLYPTPKPYSDNPNAPPENLIPPDQWTEAMENIADYATFLARELMQVELAIRMTRVPNAFLACYGQGTLTFNLQQLGHKWFEQGAGEEVDALLIHEFGHEYCRDHLSEDYHDVLCRLGAKLKQLGLDKPEIFKPFLAAQVGKSSSPLQRKSAKGNYTVQLGR